MSQKILFEGQAVKSELVVMMLEKWELHPQFEEVSANPDTGNLDRDTRVLIPEAEYERAKEILWGESEIERAGF
jgi:hypothetical protein